MLERFTKFAREVVTSAERKARALDAPAVGSEHLLLALVEKHPFILRPGFVNVAPSGEPLPDDARALRRLIEREERNALATLGISLERIRTQIETEFGKGAWEESARDRRVAFNREAKGALALSLRVALETKTGRIGPWELAIALLRQHGPARALVEELGLDAAEVENALLRTASGLAVLASR